ncbi:zinc ribbon domain-containing protein [Bradyrhizobium sp. 177]|uniref:zinc ribbon domain-containing protein n=1 Tax=Bradyrhizobium sp. 177 TaxID=2782647 RepID=UPI001FFBB3C4|nr:zinc ribbon domain-containing protein [Bradyrhizobium sp. 177]MCK1552683.1 zinc ribbon domain-containing protein [Bradyrhizobium sp. 177]
MLHGITYCGECGHKMTVRYKGGSQYVCNHLKIQRGAPECRNLRAAPIDAQVTAAFLEAVAPAEIDALSKARKAHLQSERALRHAEEQQIERLRYQAALAERQFNRADPDNRLVTGELERRWEAALLELRRAEEALAQRKVPKANDPIGVPHDLRAKVIACVRMSAISSSCMPSRTNAQMRSTISWCRGKAATGRPSLAMGSGQSLAGHGPAHSA